MVKMPCNIDDLCLNVPKNASIVNSRMSATRRRQADKCGTGHYG